MNIPITVASELWIVTDRIFFPGMASRSIAFRLFGEILSFLQAPGRRRKHTIYKQRPSSVSGNRTPDDLVSTLRCSFSAYCCYDRLNEL
jgi:hypothetical protein